MTMSLASLASPIGVRVESPSWTRWKEAGSARLLPKTGSQIRRNRRSFSNSSLRANWEIQCDSNSGGLTSLPEVIFELYEENEIEISAHDVDFLIEIASSRNVFSEMANAAIRLLGILIEEDEKKEIPLLHSKAVAVLSLLIDHQDPSRRYNAIMALWQGKVKQSIHILKLCALNESNDVVRSAAGQAVEVLMRYANSPTA